MSFVSLETWEESWLCSQMVAHHRAGENITFIIVSSFRKYEQSQTPGRVSEGWERIVS